MLQLARATQSLYYPEFLPDAARPLGLPWSSAGDRAGAVSECFGTLRYGRLVEVLLYDIRRTQTLAGPSAVYVDPETEKWLTARTAGAEVTHLVHAPSNPPGWSAGKWGEWYPDVLGSDRKLTVNEPKPYWQSGWLKQHDRLMDAMTNMKGRVPLVISGDLHAIAVGRMLRSGKLDLRANPINTVLSGPISTSPNGWPLGVPWHRRAPTDASRHGRASKGDRAAWLHDCRFHLGQNCAAAIQMGCEDAIGGDNRHAGAIPHHRASTTQLGVTACLASLMWFD